MKKTTFKKNLPLTTIDAEPEKSFWLSDGRNLKNLKELASAFEAMDETVWNHHVTSEKNDFANWVEEVFNQHQLSVLIRKAKSPRSAAKRVQSKFETSKFWSFLM